jgi:hypothetical protein
VSKYSPLGNYLATLEEKEVKLSFNQIEHIINSDLPPSAFQYEEWWANDSVSHTQSIKGWLNVGWKKKILFLHKQSVVFIKIK